MCDGLDRCPNPQACSVRREPDPDVCRHCGYTRRWDDPAFINGLCVRAAHEGDPSCWSRAGRPEPRR